MLFEVLGKRGNGEFGANWFPVQVWKKFESGKLDELIKSFGIPETHKGKAKVLLMVAFWCTQYTVEIRPSMRTVVMVLEMELSVNTPPYPFVFQTSLNLSMLPPQEMILEIRSEASSSVHESSALLNPTDVVVAPEEVENNSDDEQAITNFSEKGISDVLQTSLNLSMLPPQEMILEIRSEASSSVHESSALLNPTDVVVAPEEVENNSDDEQAITNFSEKGISDVLQTSLNLSMLPPQEMILEIRSEASSSVHESPALLNPTVVVVAPEEVENNSDDEQAISNFSEKGISEEGMTISEIQRLLSELTIGRPQQFSRSDIETFTTNFSEYIGRGGFGSVYKGQLPTGVEVTIEVLHGSDDIIDETTFMVIVMTMGKLYHPNIVKLHGYCFDGHMKALIYESIKNGSLDMILYRNNRPDMDWDQLYEIAIEIAKGLSALHAVGIIHRDIEASSILLDSNLSPKITSFELEGLIIMKRDDDEARIVRSIGYSSPEMWMPTSVVTCKSDVYSFGMLLFEVLGRRSISNHRGQEWFPAQVWKMLNKGVLHEFMNDCEINLKDRKKAYNLCKVALWCAQFDPEGRPSMSSVLKMLEMEIPVPVPPNPFHHAQLSSTSLSLEASPRFDSEASPSVEALSPTISNPTFVVASDVFINAFEKDERKGKAVKDSDDEQTKSICEQLQSEEIVKLRSKSRTARPQPFSFRESKTRSEIVKFQSKLGTTRPQPFSFWDPPNLFPRSQFSSTSSSQKLLSIRERERKVVKQNTLSSAAKRIDSVVVPSLLLSKGESKVVKEKTLSSAAKRIYSLVKSSIRFKPTHKSPSSALSEPVINKGESKVVKRKSLLSSADKRMDSVGSSILSKTEHVTGKSASSQSNPSRTQIARTSTVVRSTWRPPNLARR